MSVRNRTPAVLIVEDEGIVAKDLQQSLSALGYDASLIASSAAEAVARFEERPTDIVLMDIRLKGPLDGIATAEILRGRFDVPIVFLTAHADDATIDRAKMTEPHSYLLKPVKPAELRSAIEIALHRHEMERALREREHWLSTTLRSLAAAVISVDLSGRVIFLNTAAETLLGVTSSEARGKCISDVVHLVDAQSGRRLDSPLDHALRAAHQVTLSEISLSGPVDAPTPVRLSASPVMDGERALGTVFVLEDLTEQKRLRVAEEVAQVERVRSEHAEATVRQRDEFLAVAAHELRTPLTALQLKLQVLRAGVDSASDWTKFAARLDSAIQSTTRLGRLIEQLLDVSRIVTGRLEVHREDCDLAALLQEVAGDFREQAQASNCELHVTFLGDARGSWDRGRIAQAVRNLLSNALKFGAGKPVEASVEREGRSVRLMVADGGIGISKSDAQRIFDRFERAVAVRRYSGMGLGLYITKQIVEAHGGTISVQSSPGEGSVFTVELPVIERAVRTAARQLEGHV